MGQIRVRGQQSREELVKYRHAPRFAPAGQSTQLIVGATADTDFHILRLTQGQMCIRDRYFPAVDREDAAAAETESFLSRVYGGSLGLMMSAMVESRQLTEADIAELSAILERAGGEEHA